MVAFSSRNGAIRGFLRFAAIRFLMHQPVAGQQCDEYRFNVSACMLSEGSSTMAACQSCLVSGLNEIQGLVPNPQVSSTSTAEESLPTNSSNSYCDQANQVLCSILQFDCQQSCLLTSCYNTTTSWAACMAESYAPNCNVTCPEALRNSTASNETDDAGGGATGTSGASAGRAAATIVATVAFVAVAWGGLETHA